MSFKIVVDSCCDLTPAMLKDPAFVKVPLTIRANGSTFIDDETFDQADLLWAMRQSEEAASTACPSPQDYLDAYRGADDVYVVTLSALLSGSHNCAEQARLLLEEEEPEVNVHVFNSCSASAGETHIALALSKLASSGMPFGEVVAEMDRRIAQMNTLFVLENLDVLRKAGRLTRVQSLVTGALRVKLVMGSTPQGEIMRHGQALSIKQALNKLCAIMAADQRHRGRLLCISHCLCRERAEYLRALAFKTCDFADVRIEEARGISSFYANSGGIVAAY